MRIMAEWARQQLFSLAEMCDVSIAAVYSVIRSLAIPCLSSDESVAKLVKYLGFEPAAIHQLAEALGRDALTEAGVSRQLSDVVADYHADTWAATEGVLGVGRVTRRTLPGDPMWRHHLHFSMITIFKQVR